MRLLSFCFTYMLQKHPQDDVLGVGSAPPWVHWAGVYGSSARIPACSCFSEFHGVVKVGQCGQSLLIVQVPWTLSVMFWGPEVLGDQWPGKDLSVDTAGVSRGGDIYKSAQRPGERNSPFYPLNPRYVESSAQPTQQAHICHRP